ncbi:MAG: DUF4114 domain-containing protein [Myxococcales bacterium]|nr:DUF4114 domain-containing protein [Myxococcales bacterium]
MAAVRTGVRVLGTMTVLALAATATALTQPNGDPVPTQPGCNGGLPTGLAATFACVCTQPGICNIGVPCPSPGSCDDGQNGTCETTLWHTFNDNTCIPSNLSGLDPYAEAAVLPETFHPTCPQTFSLVTRGTALFKNAFGWYNVTGSAPQPSDLHVMLDCNSTPGATAVLDLQAEPAYQGGEIGFFLVTPESHGSPGSCAAGNCCASVARLGQGEGYAYYSERSYNPDAQGADSLIHLLTYQSHLASDKFYFAWEDIFGASNNDFTDVVTAVTGLKCSGGGQPCDTGALGICGRGLTVCHQGQLACEAVFAAGAEGCNGVDDDCDGDVDDAASCPSPDDVCYQGSCVHSCTSGEFPCPPDKTCDTTTGYCLEASCIGQACAGGTICRDGACVAPCSGVVCPHGQECVADRCLDLCASVTCGAGETCVDGKCVGGCNQCNGITCTAPLGCDTTTGACRDLSCATPCPAGTYCHAGTCEDACAGALCPGGETCVDGACAGSGAGGAGGSNLPGPGGQGGSAGASAPSDPNAVDTSSDGGCSCRAGSKSRGASLAFLSLGLAGVFGARRRRRPS